ncbi:MAG: hypothetical protein EXR50_00170 [Dehalococcoidia bacterium]|nr:hypothetical protein [Dehalococcoidia bacterium]
MDYCKQLPDAIVLMDVQVSVIEMAPNEEDDAKATVTQQAEASKSPNDVWSSLRRFCEFSGDWLALKTTLKMVVGSEHTAHLIRERIHQ